MLYHSFTEDCYPILPQTIWKLNNVKKFTLKVLSENIFQFRKKKENERNLKIKSIGFIHNMRYNTEKRVNLCGFRWVDFGFGVGFYVFFISIKYWVYIWGFRPRGFDWI